jgi:hypothetical protein
MWSATAIGVYGLVSSLEDLAHCEETFGDPSLLSWRLAQLNWKWLYRGLSGRLINALLAYPNIRGVLWVRLLVSAGLALTVLWGTVPPVLVWGLFLSELALFVRNRVGQDGSRQMAVIVLLYLAIVTTFPATQWLQMVAPAYVAAQLVAAYWFSGFAKLISRTWRSGDAFRRIMSTRDYGNQIAYGTATRYPAMSRIVCWFVILSELAFVGVLLVPPAYAPYLIALGVINHGVIAVIMGLNLFFFSFLAAYPALVLTVAHLHALFGGSS